MVVVAVAGFEQISSIVWYII